jgi:hypothetical protein
MKWREITLTSEMSPPAKLAAARLNSLGSLFWFVKYTLRRSRLSPNLHGYICSELEQDSLRLGLEVPRDMFKTTCASEGASMWWALPFNDNDEELMRSVGYGDEWIRWMRRAHNPNTRTLIASEIIDNAVKIGSRISGHYESNALFRELFKEIIPKNEQSWTGGAGSKTKKRWNVKSMTHARSESHGEGTYDLIGVKGALQSRHYDRQIIDDPVGEKAIASDLVMEATTDWIQKLSGALDSYPGNPDVLGDQLFIGNRWSNRDVGSWLRKHMPSMRFVTHSAEGGCCALHKHGESIFPEEFSMDKLRELRQIWGGYNYAAQYLNNPVDPEAVRFKPSWLRYYTQVPMHRAGFSVANSQQLNYQPTPEMVMKESAKAELSGQIPERLIMAIQHEVQSGEVIEDMRAGEMHRVAIMDPNHSEENGRSRNAIVVLGMYSDPKKPRRLYLLDVWAEASSHETMIDRLIGTRPERLGLAVKWRVHHIYVESEVAGQQGWKFLLKDRVQRMGVHASFSIRPLKTDRSAGGKDKRIIGMESLYENGLFWVRRTGQEAFMEEYEQYPNGATKDILDIIGYSPQTWEPGSRVGTREFVAGELQRRAAMAQSVGPAGY